MDIGEMNEEVEEMNVDEGDGMQDIGDPEEADTGDYAGEAPGLPDDINDPREYLDVLDMNYADMEQREGKVTLSFANAVAAWKKIAAEEGVTLEQVAAAESLTLKEWLDKQQALYRRDNLPGGVAHLEMVDDDRKDLQKTEVELEGVVSAIREALDAIQGGTKVQALSLHLASQAEDQLASAYRSLVDLKLGMDKMEEIPNYLQPLYKATMKAMTTAGKAKQEAGQVSGLARKVSQKVRGTSEFRQSDSAFGAGNLFNTANFSEVSAQMREATKQEYARAASKAGQKRHMPWGKQGGSGGMDVILSDRGTEVAQKTTLYKRGKAYQESYMVNPDYL